MKPTDEDVAAACETVFGRQWSYIEAVAMRLVLTRAMAKAHNAAIEEAAMTIRRRAGMLDYGRAYYVGPPTIGAKRKAAMIAGEVLELTRGVQ